MVLPLLQNNHRSAGGRCGPSKHQGIAVTIILLAVAMIAINYGDDTDEISNNFAAKAAVSQIFDTEQYGTPMQPPPDFYDREQSAKNEIAFETEPVIEPEMQTPVESYEEEPEIQNYVDIIEPSVSSSSNLPPVDLNCEINAAQPPSDPITPVYTASYPGSGAKLTCRLIEALTGIVTVDDFNASDQAHAVAIKTHYPHPYANNEELSGQYSRSIVIMRNPINAIPSLYNYLYEKEYKLPEHSIAPLDEWVSWRDINFEREISSWASHIRHWMYRSASKSDRLVISYERLTDEALGPLEVTRLSEFVGREEGVSVRQPEEMPCVWWKVINFKKLALLLQAQNWNGRLRMFRGRRLQEAGFVPPPASGEKIIAQIQQDADAKKEAAAETTAEAEAAQPDPNAPQLTEEQMMMMEQKQQEQQQQLQPFQQEQEQILMENSVSVRSGTKYLPPYTESQLLKAIDVVNILLNEFENEQTLSTALNSYILAAMKRLELVRKENEHLTSNIAAAVEYGAPPPIENPSPLT